jgi:hypothetical protein
MVRMAMFSFDLRHFEFDHGVRLLKQGYEASRDALLGEVERIKAKAHAYEEGLANGGEWIGEREDGHILWEQSQFYDMEIADAHQAIYEVRRAFIIALYHHWERSAVVWLGKDAPHEELERYCSESGFGPASDIGAVRCLANHLKHKPWSNSKWLNKLRDEYPSFMPRVAASVSVLSDIDIETVAAVILASGPPKPAR